MKPACGPDAVFHPGSVAYFDLEIITERDKTAGPMTIEAPIPVNLTEPVLTFVNAQVVSKGKTSSARLLGMCQHNDQTGTGHPFCAFIRFFNFI